MNSNNRVYPVRCQLMYCGNLPDACPTCQDYQSLKDFKKWVQDNCAVVLDPIWNPAVYTAQIK